MIDHAVILAAHGGGDGSAANRLVMRLAETVSAHGTFDRVVPAFHLGSPTFATVIDGLQARRITVVPIMTSQGYYCDVVLPRELARNATFDAARVHVTAPLGTHQHLAVILAQRVRRLSSEHACDPATTAVAVVGHGTLRHAHSRRTALDLAAILETRCGLTSVAVFIDDRPALSDLGALVDHDNVIVMPFLIGGGAHATVDIAEQLGDARLAGRHIITDAPLGETPEMAGLICACAVPPVRLGTRGSRLARVQAERVAERLRAAGVNVDLIELDTSGDRDRTRPIAELDGAAPFADDIERALLDGDIDLAVHSLKDLAPEPRPGLALAAILERAAPGEALVARGHMTLDQLPAGARVGTSSARRAAQVLARRPDVVIAPLRGPVEERVRRVRSGTLDAAILAAAGLSRLNILDEASELFAPTTLLPAPGQGAIVVQVRADDAATREVLAPLDHRPTRAATAAELGFARQHARRDPRPVAAYATCADTITLHVRVMTPDGRACHDAVVTADTADAVIAAALERIPGHDLAAADTNGTAP